MTDRSKKTSLEALLETGVLTELGRVEHRRRRSVRSGQAKESALSGPIRQRVWGAHAVISTERPHSTSMPLPRIRPEGFEPPTDGLEI